MSQPISWPSENQRYVSQSVELLRQRLTVAQTENAVSQQPLNQPAWPTDQPPPALATLCKVLTLSPFERDLLLLCAAVEIDPSLAPIYAALQGNPPRPYPTLNLALRCLANAHWKALTPAAPLRYWQLIEPIGDDPLTTQALRIDERILHYLMGVTYLDPQIENHVMPLAVPRILPLSHQRLAERMQLEWNRLDELPAINVYGATAASRAAITATACAKQGAHPYLLEVTGLPQTTAERIRLQHRWEREAALGNHALLIELSPLTLREKPAFLEAFMQRQKGRLILSSDDPLLLPHRPTVRIEVARPTNHEQMMLWHQVLGAAHTDLDLGSLVSQFDLDPDGIFQVSDQVAQTAAAGAAQIPPVDTVAEERQTQLWQACRRQARITLDGLAQRLTPMATWENLVLPAAQLRTLKAIVASVKQRSQVYEDWGFGQKSNRGLGISALFSGGSGTGKTLSAEVLAQALQLDLYRIDLSAVVSKYIGETEKNLRRIFDAAEQGGVILLFDEADALFGKRSEVKDSHDRHANIEVSYLLQRMESYRGLAILTTNFKNAIDSAFLRRIRFVVSFPFPDVAQRLEMWQRVFPAQTPTQGLDPAKLARLTVPGGNIYSIAMNAAFLASAEATPVQMHHLLQAAQSEYTKLNKKLADAEVRGWI